jgi:hypothetical protein
MKKHDKKEKVRPSKSISDAKKKMKSVDEISEFTENEKFVKIGKEVVSQKEEKKKRAEELIIANDTHHETKLIDNSQKLLTFSLDKNYCYTNFNENHRQEMKKV